MLTDRARRGLESFFSRRDLLTDPVELITYESDASFERGRPDAVVFPKTAAELAVLVNWANEHHVVLIARGAGTGLSGGAVAERGGVIVEFSRMNRVVRLDESGKSATVEPGVLNLQLDELARQVGLCYPPDPSSQRSSTIGGNIAENAGGPHCFKYGVTTNYVTGADLVLADGKRVRVGGRALDYPEYDLTGLIVGSEGTLALIAGAEVRLVRCPPGVKTMMAIFDSVAACGAAVSAVIAAGLVPATLELMDGNFARAVEEYAHAGLPMDAGAVLIAEVDGYAAGLDAQMQEVAQILEKNGGRGLRIAQNAQERDLIWRARKSAAGVFAHLAPSYYLVDITVPRSRLAETIETCSEICRRAGLDVQYVLHAGDGNLHPVLLIPRPGDPQLVHTVHQAAREMVELGVRANGSLTGEHGVGIEKREYMGAMFNPAEMSAQWDIKQVFDPGGLFNPGKVFPGSTFERADEATGPADSAVLITPSSTEQASRLFFGLSKARRRARIGQGVPEELQISTAALNRIISYSPDDLTVTVGAGVLVSELQSFLARDRMQVPIAAPWPEATVGGLVAANVNAPLRLRYGGLRDLVLAMTVVLGDGRAIRAGRPVVKNVAGYDLPKVLVGSQGSLGLIVDITFKLSHLPRARRTLLWRSGDMCSLLDHAVRASSKALIASAVIVQQTAAGGLLAYTAEGFAQDVDSELEEVRGCLVGLGEPGFETIGSPTGTDLWCDTLARACSSSLIVRIGVAPGKVAEFSLSNDAILCENEAFVDVPHGLVYASSSNDLSEAKNWVSRVRDASTRAGGYAAIMSLPKEWSGMIPAPGNVPETMDLMRKLKARWDPVGVLPFPE